MYISDSLHCWDYSNFISLSFFCLFRYRSIGGYGNNEDISGTINQPLLYEQKIAKKEKLLEGREEEKEYDLLVPGGKAVLYLVLLGTAVVIGQHIMYTFHLYQYF